MNKFDPAKLSTDIKAPATQFGPVDNRKYTLTHSDTNGEFLLKIGCHFDLDAVNSKQRDEVFAEWKPKSGQYILFGRVYISNGDFDEKYSQVRFLIFQRELELALTAITYGDQAFFTYYPWLLDSPIYIQFESVYPQFNKIVYQGTPRQYLNVALKKTVS
ncbi:hypothetical protein CVD25_13900 [Bacillus canaveralius]|uniref:Staygreen protein domain-containing protein n=1 Tax=Bacillus canaveralius TaxID=1403243 RepID=A0A2N5GLC6_9BACI|nr:MULTISPECIES: staygreen family protein [Bacillus]PLR82442.1 hypothetical protein CU635_11565 [Bacillus canaveralius]PLR85699.1 hypothetical protein CVD23_08380 [Bacillus sp. V33-4]PLR95613.1 hypothetical protein CVD25_13900 [Bacillus canaveralius]RSK52836.1 hypothetical protein EJA13_10200 [Bacillus canaveralius]